MTDMTHLTGRAARVAGAPGNGFVTDHWGGAPIPAHIPVVIDSDAAEYVRLVAEGGTEGAAWAYLNRLRHDPPPGFDVWRFCEAVARRLVRKDG